MVKGIRITRPTGEVTIAADQSESFGDKARRLTVETEGAEPCWIVYSAATDVVAAALVESPTSSSAALKSPGSVARLFVAFPLTGTQCFPLPLRSEEHTSEL